MRIWVLVLCVIALAASGCSVCVNACKKDQGRVVNAVMPSPDGTIQVQTCTLTTEGTSSTVAGCASHVVPAPSPKPPN